MPWLWDCMAGEGLSGRLQRENSISAPRCFASAPIGIGSSGPGAPAGTHGRYCRRLHQCLHEDGVAVVLANLLRSWGHCHAGALR